MTQFTDNRILIWPRMGGYLVALWREGVSAPDDVKWGATIRDALSRLTFREEVTH